MTPADCLASLDELLRECTMRALDLKAILDIERDVLASADIEALDRAGEEKQACLDELEALEARRARVCVASGFGVRPRDMSAIAAWCGSEDLAIRWKDYLAIAQECSELNARNGAIINIRRSQIQHTLSLLRNGQAGSDTYGPGGRETSAHGTRTLAEA